MLAPIKSRNHDVVKKLRRLRTRNYRERSGSFLVEGLNLLQEATDAGARFREIAYVYSRAEEAAFLRSRISEPIPAYEISADLMGWVSDVVTAQGIIGVLDQIDTPYEELDFGEATLLLVADQVRDPGNLGSLLRIADSVGVDAFLMTPGCVDLYNPKVVRSAAGSHFHVKVTRGVDLAGFKRDINGRMSLLGLDPRGEMDYLDVDMTSPVSLMVGNEAFGIVEEDQGVLDGTICIGMPGRSESLNVASAAAVVLFEAVRQRGRKRSGDQ
jgi:RNA methyltransferase, TrmH family